MVLALDEARAAAAAGGLEPWQPARARSAADILARAYAGSLEATLYPDLASPAGCLRVIRGLTRAGMLLAEASGLILVGGEPAGTIVAARLAAQTAGIEHVAVLPALRGQGLGKRMLGWSLERLRAAGFARVELHVTRDNAPAVRLYQAAGFNLLSVYEARG